MKKNYSSGLALIFIYIISGFAIFSGYFQTFWTLLICLLINLAWDLVFSFCDKNYGGRSIAEINESITRARTYISWCLGFYGVLVGFVLTRASTGNVLTSIVNSAPPVIIISLPLVLSIISMLFVPLHLKSGQEDSDIGPSNALKSLFFIVIFLQKVILILIGFIITWILPALV